MASKRKAREWWSWVYVDLAGRTGGYLYESREAVEHVHGDKDPDQIIRVREVLPKRKGAKRGE